MIQVPSSRKPRPGLEWVLRREREAGRPRLGRQAPVRRGGSPGRPVLPCDSGKLFLEAQPRICFFSPPNTLQAI